jgi:hypothetical protein
VEVFHPSVTSDLWSDIFFSSVFYTIHIDIQKIVIIYEKLCFCIAVILFEIALVFLQHMVFGRNTKLFNIPAALNCLFAGGRALV